MTTHVPIILAFIIASIRLPLPAYGCVVKNCDRHFRDAMGLRNHMQKTHKITGTDQTLIKYLENVIGAGAMKGIDENNKPLDESDFICPVKDCPYIGDRRKYSMHIDKVHGELKRLISLYGEFWGLHIFYARTENRIPTIGDIIHERECVICKHDGCNTCMMNEKALECHAKVHNMRSFREGLPEHIKSKIQYFDSTGNNVQNLPIEVPVTVNVPENNINHDTHANHIHIQR